MARARRVGELPAVSGVSGAPGPLKLYVYKFSMLARGQCADFDGRSRDKVSAHAYNRNEKWEPHALRMVRKGVHDALDVVDDPTAADWYLVDACLARTYGTHRTRRLSCFECDKLEEQLLLEMRAVGPFWDLHPHRHIVTHTRCPRVNANSTYPNGPIFSRSGLWPQGRANSSRGPVVICSLQSEPGKPDETRQVHVPFHVPLKLQSILPMNHRPQSIFYGGSLVHEHRKQWIEPMLKEGSIASVVLKSRVPTVSELQRIHDNAHQSKFVLCPPGDTPESTRIYEAIALGTPPLIVVYDQQDVQLQLPGPSALWDSIAIRVNLSELRCNKTGCAKRLHELPAVAHALSPTHYPRLLEQLTRYRNRFLWGTPEFSIWFGRTLLATLQKRNVTMAGKTTISVEQQPVARNRSSQNSRQMQKQKHVLPSRHAGFRSDLPRTYTAQGINESLGTKPAPRSVREERHNQAVASCQGRNTGETHEALNSGAWCLSEAAGQGQWVQLPHHQSYALPHPHVAADSGIVTFLDRLLRECDADAGIRCDTRHSLIDLGAGVGQYGHALLAMEPTHQYRGYDGAGNVEQVTRGFIQWADLTDTMLKLPAADWVLSLEVGEHIPHHLEECFVRNLHAFNRRGVVLSWGHLGQPGYGHINNHGRKYIQSIFTGLGYWLDEEATLRLRANRSSVDQRPKIRNVSQLYAWFSQSLYVFRRHVRVQ